VTNSIFTNDTAPDGGAIYNDGTLNLTSNNFTNNTAPDSGGAIYNTGGTDESGIFYGTLNVTNCIFTNDTAPDGGAICNNEYGNLTVTSSTFTNNTAIDGGAIYNDGDGTATMRFNRIINNINYDIYNNGGSVDALYNWWGTNFAGTNPVTAGRINSATSLWMVLSIGAHPPLYSRMEFLR